MASRPATRLKLRGVRLWRARHVDRGKCSVVGCDRGRLAARTVRALRCGSGRSVAVVLPRSTAGTSRVLGQVRVIETYPQNPAVYAGPVKGRWSDPL
jgi:hypothetical protein